MQFCCEIDQLISSSKKMLDSKWRGYFITTFFLNRTKILTLKLVPHFSRNSFGKVEFTGFFFNLYDFQERNLFFRSIVVQKYSFIHQFSENKIKMFLKQFFFKLHIIHILSNFLKNILRQFFCITFLIFFPIKKKNI